MSEGVELNEVEIDLILKSLAQFRGSEKAEVQIRLIGKLIHEQNRRETARRIGEVDRPRL